MLFQLSNVLQGTWYEKRFEFFFDVQLITSMKLSHLVADFNNKGEGPFEQ